MQDVITFVNGRAYKKEELLPQGKYKILRVGNFFTNNEWYYSDLELPEDKYCYNGDLLYAWSASFGPQIWNGDKTIFHYHIWNVKFNSRILFRDYLYYFFLFDKTQVKASTTGSTMVHVSMENMKPRLIPIPPVNEQKRIVHEIENIIPLIERYGTFQNKKEILDSNIKASLKKSILQEAIQGKLVPQIPEEGTAQELLEQIKTEKQKLVKEGKLKKSAINSSVIFRGDDNKYYEKIGKNCVDITEELPFDLPNNWTWCRLGNLVSITSGENLTSKQMHNGKIPVYGGNGITGYHSKANIFEETIVIGRVGYYCGSIHLTPCQAWVTDNAFITQYSKLLNRDFLIYLLTALNLGKCCNATAQPVVSGKKIYPLLIALPPFKEQQRIVAQIENLFEQLH